MCASRSSGSFPVSLHNPVHPLGNHVTRHAEEDETSSDAVEPGQVALIFLTGNPHVHTPETGDDVHGQDDGTQDCQLSQHIGGLFLSLIHTNIDLSEVIAVGSSKDPVNLD